MTDSSVLSKTLRGSTLVLIVAIVASATFIRLYNLDARTLSHPEAYIPRIDFPEYATSPIERQTLPQVLWSTVNQDVHPPGYYVLMWMWTGMFGTGLFAMRLPSALAGAATVLLLYRLSRPTDGPRVALMASALLALNGHHVFWSQSARMWVLIAFLAVASSVVLSRLVQRWSSGDACLYLALITLGLWTEYYFWPLLFAQVLWTARYSLSRARLPAPLMLQTVSLILAAPVLMLATVHSQSSSYLSRSFGTHFLDLAAFSRAFVLAAAVRRFSWLGYGLIGCLAFVGTILFVAGVRARVKDAAVDSAPPPPDRYARGFVAPPLVAALVVSGFTLFAGDSFGAGSAKRLAVALALPWMFATLWWGLGIFDLGARVAAALNKNRVVRSLLMDLVVALAIVPVILLFAISTTTPMLAARALLMVSPFWLLLMARGMAGWLGSRASVTVAWLSIAALGIGSTYHHALIPNGPRDYQSIAMAMRPQMQSGDIVVVENNYWSQPIHYYLPENVRTVSSVEEARDEANVDPARIWVVAFQGDAPSLRDALESSRLRLDDYVELEQVSVGRIVVGLYRKR